MATIRLKEKQNTKLPKGAEIVNKRVTIEVEEIENGFLISKDYSIEYRAKESQHTDYLYYCKKMYSDTNPFDETKNKELVDLFK